MTDTLAIAFATSQDVPDLTDDDRLLVRSLRELGVKAGPVIWSNAALDWHLFSAVVIRSCWDYHKRHDEFLAWVDRLAADGVRVFNPPALVRWNSEKTYLRDLEKLSIPVVPTHWVEKDTAITLGKVLEKNGWRDAVVKPAISASAHETWRTSAATAAADDARFQQMAARGRVLVQPFLDVIQREGEWSVLFYGGAYSHAVLKKPGEGDFRVQKEHGGSAMLQMPPGGVIDAARRALRASAHGREESLYARVDGCVLGGQFMLMELELIEPDLFMRSQPGAPERLASALLSSLR